MEAKGMVKSRKRRARKEAVNPSPSKKLAPVKVIEGYGMSSASSYCLN